jgi:hypothetical protein
VALAAASCLLAAARAPPFPARDTRPSFSWDAQWAVLGGRRAGVVLCRGREPVYTMGRVDAWEWDDISTTPATRPSRAPCRWGAASTSWSHGNVHVLGTACSAGGEVTSVTLHGLNL